MTLNEITNKAIQNKKDFMYKLNKIPNFIYLNEVSYSEIMECKSLNYDYNVNFNTFIGLEIILTKDDKLDLKVGIKQ